MAYIYICICKSCSSRVNETEKPFKDSLSYLSNPLNPCPHPPNPRFKDSPWNLNNLNLLQLIFTSKSLGSQQTCVKFLFQFRKKRKLDFINFFFVFFLFLFHSIPRIPTLIPRIPTPIPAFPPWFPACTLSFLAFPTPFPAFSPHSPHSHSDSSHSPYFQHSQPHSPHSHHDFPHSDLDSPHSHRDSPRYHHDSSRSDRDSPRSRRDPPRSHDSPHSVLRFPIAAFTDSLNLATMWNKKHECCRTYTYDQISSPAELFL